MNYIAGTPYLGASVRMYPGPGGYQGELVAWDVANAKKVWSVKDADLPVYSGVLATGGDLVFYGTMEGWFRAVDAHSGKGSVGIQNRVRDYRRSNYILWSGWQTIRGHLFGNRRLDGRHSAARCIHRRSLRYFGRYRGHEEDQELCSTGRPALCLQLLALLQQLLGWACGACV